MTALKYWQINTLKIQNLRAQEIYSHWDLYSPDDTAGSHVGIDLPSPGGGWCIAPPSAPLATTAQISLGCCATGTTPACCSPQHRGHSSGETLWGSFCYQVKWQDTSFSTKLWPTLGQESQSMVGRRSGTWAAFPTCFQHRGCHFS